MAGEKNITSKATAERLAGLLNTYYAKKTDIPSVSVVEKSAANTGYLKSYQVTVDGSPVGVDIDIPKDFLVKSASIGTVTAADKQTGGKFADDSSFNVGDKYLDFTVNVQTGTATDSHIYLNVKDLAHVYSAGNGVAVSASDEISVTVDASNARGLSVGTGGLALALATPDTYTDGSKTADGTPGAMSSADKYKLDHALMESDLSDYTEAELRTLLGLPAAE